MKIIYLVCFYVIIYLMFVKFKVIYDFNYDTFRIEFLLIFVVGLVCLVNYEFLVLEVGVGICYLSLNYFNYYLIIIMC